ncbi:MAG: DUF1800 domain-containing protein [Sphingomonas sp.]|nr:DUF1800 domain-containing protein [Sphingomonas sp.]
MRRAGGAMTDLLLNADLCDEADQRPDLDPDLGSDRGSADLAVRPSSLRYVVPIGAALALEACGEGSGTITSGTATPTPTPTSTAPPTSVQASRFLAQATFGASQADISQVQSLGYAGWITDQIARPRGSHWDWLVANGYLDVANLNNSNGFDNSVWRQIITEPGQLRQRVGMALSEIIVVGLGGVTLSWRQFVGAAYLDILLDNAFGNFRTLIEQITTNAGMASFLTYLNNRRENTATGALPDENYARELMQLFSIGLYQLNMDGTLKMSGGNPIETYSQNDVSQLARVFTGLVLDSNDNSTPNRLRRPLVMNASLHETGASTFLGTTIPAGTEGMAAVRMALDAIFAHPNVPPFISKQLIQRLVTSNPSPAYVGRVAAVFANNGSGVRGDLAAVVRAILLDTEARSDASLTSASAGKIREPVIRLTNWARSFGATSAGGLWPIGDTSSNSTRLAQALGRSPSVFNFFRPGYTPPNTQLASQSLVAPELQITDELSVVGYVNFIRGFVANSNADIKADYSDLIAKAADSQALVDDVNLRLAAGQLSSATVATIRAAVDSVATTAANFAMNRVAIAVLLAMASPDYIALK